MSERSDGDWIAVADARSADGDWIAVDWGTTSMRARLVSADGEVLTEAPAGPGMGELSSEGFEPALLHAVEGWLGGEPVETLVCGMAGARQGWREAPYAEVPTGLTALLPRAVRVETADARLAVRIVPGVAFRDPSGIRADVMRGEETQLAGLLAQVGASTMRVCLPGTHTKWATVEEGVLTDFDTVMAGELHALLRERSILRHSVDDAWSDAAFDDAVADALEARGEVLPLLFPIRAHDLLAGFGPGEASARLSGLLIGSDVAHGLSEQGDVHIVGGDRLATLYARAIETAGRTAIAHDGGALAVAGLHAMRQA